MVQLLICEFELFGRGPFAFTGFRLKTTELFDDRADRIFASRLHDLAALKLVRIHIADQLAQRFEMFAARVCLIVIFDEWNRQALRLQGKGLIMLDSIHG